VTNNRTAHGVLSPSSSLHMHYIVGPHTHTRHAEHTRMNGEHCTHLSSPRIISLPRQMAHLHQLASNITRGSKNALMSTNETKEGNSCCAQSDT
jgi:hypothetical protein